VNNLTFSQANLEDYRACPRKFQLRYLEGQRWPALVAEPPDAFEEHLRQGTLLHRMIQQHLLGFPEGLITAYSWDEPLATWWQRYRSFPPPDLPRQKIPEFETSTWVDGFHLVGKFDLLAFDPVRKFVIVDWKTDRRPPSFAQAAERLQTRIYPFLLVESGGFLNNEMPIDPRQVEMLYWYAEAPTELQRFKYTEDQHEANRAYLISLIDEIQQETSKIFPLTEDVSKCAFCSFRSLCARGSLPGPFDQLYGDVEDEEAGIVSPSDNTIDPAPWMA